MSESAHRSASADRHAGDFARHAEGGSKRFSDPDMTWSELMRATHIAEGLIAEDHFTTSIDVDDTIARFLMRRSEGLGLADPWIVDVGAGRGHLLEQLLELGFPGSRLLGVDVRPAPDLPVRWIQGVAPDCLPPVAGIVFVHEFLDDVPADVVREGRVERVDGRPGPPATPAQQAWAAQWGDGVCGVARDEVWAQVADRVVLGEAIAVDFSGGGPVGHNRGRRGAWGADICAGVNFTSLRARTGGQVVPQHRLFPRHRVLGDRQGLGSFLWLFAGSATPSAAG